MNIFIPISYNCWIMHHLALASIYPSLISSIRWGLTLPSSCWPSLVWTVWRTNWTRPRTILEFLTMEESPSPTALTQTLGTSLCVCMCAINYTLSLMWKHCSLSLSPSPSDFGQWWHSVVYLLLGSCTCPTLREGVRPKRKLPLNYPL